MQSRNIINLNSHGWLGFELGVLRRLKFRSAALAFSGEPQLGLALKRWNVRINANDPAQWAWIKAIAFIENNSDTLNEADIDKLLDDTYVPRSAFSNPALSSWFNETDAWWFDNVRSNAELFEAPGCWRGAKNGYARVEVFGMSSRRTARENLAPRSSPGTSI